ncbi:MULTISPECIES: DUF2382 domain-containing protein [Actinomadura]|uniref:DUF2382 domain-containing protein n=1 Tax=Actinomadura TaxID=1988 RepID=UPI0004796A14|nr:MULTISPECIES: PRC and DUF2382 domain-containing protein [Actinomadura]
MQTQTQVRELMGMSVSDTNGTKVGTIKQVYLNDDSGAPEWITVHTGWFGMRESFVPLTGSHKEADMLQVPYDKETIKGAPNVDADEHLSHAQIVDLYRHYGVRPPAGGRTGEQAPAGGTGRTDTPAEGRTAEGRAAPAGPSGTTGAAGAAGTAGAAGMAVRPDRAKRGEQAGRTAPDAAAGRTMPEQRTRTEAEPGAEGGLTEIVRCEEQIHVGTERHEAGRVRVRKWIETETVERTVPCTHDEIKIDREPITGAQPGTRVTITEDDKEIVLYEERPVVTKEAVPVERVRVRTEQVQDEQTVRSELRKERVEVTREGEAGRSRDTAGGRRTGGGRKS